MKKKALPRHNASAEIRNPGRLCTHIELLSQRLAL